MKKSKSRPLGAELLAWNRETRELADKTAQFEKKLEQLAERLHELDGPTLARIEGQFDLLLKIFPPDRPAPKADDPAKS